VTHPSRRKGNREERQFLQWIEEAGVPVEKVPLSGSLGGKYSGDLYVYGHKTEVKYRKGGKGFKILEEWLEGNVFLFLRRWRKNPLVAMEWETFLKLMSGQLGKGPHSD